MSNEQIEKLEITHSEYKWLFSILARAKFEIEGLVYKGIPYYDKFSFIYKKELAEEDINNLNAFLAKLTETFVLKNQ